jgi:transcriptional regulator with XRE-family HTH domain
MKHEWNFRASGAELRAARRRLKWSVRRLSIESGIHRSTIANIEAGKSRGWPEILRALQHALESGGAVFAIPPPAALPHASAEAA